MKLEKVTKNAETTPKRWYDDACGAALGMELVGERWSLLVVRELLLGARRFGELRAGLAGISANVLTQRLQGLEEAGIVERRRLPPPANVQVYALTAWGRECEPIVLGLGRWALRSPRHDPRMPFSPVSFMLALKMLLVPERAVGLALRIGFVLSGERYRAVLAGGVLVVTRDDAIDACAAMIAAHPNALLPVFYGGAPLETGAGITVTGDAASAARFATLFRLPDKAAAG